MERRYLFGANLPLAFRAPAVNKHLSFNGQLHFSCGGCKAITWGDVTFSEPILDGRVDYPCPACLRENIKPIKFVSSESRCCLTCGLAIEDPIEALPVCPVCQTYNFGSVGIVISPPYPPRLHVMMSSDILGESVEDDVECLMNHLRGLRMSPDFHETSIHYVAFIESLFEHVYEASPDACDLLNVASGLMRQVYRESNNPDAGFLAVSLMMRGRFVTEEPLQRAVYGLNICQNLYSILAQGQEELLEPLFGEPLKGMATTIARETVAAFEAIDEPAISELRARSKWLLGDILKAGKPSRAEIAEALQWFEAALADDALPPDVVDHVRSSALVAQSRMEDDGSIESDKLWGEWAALAEENLSDMPQLERLRSLGKILDSKQWSSPAQRQAFAKRCYGEVIAYVAANDPAHMLRHAGSQLAQLVARFAVDQFEAGAVCEALASVEGFRSLAIHHGERQTHELQREMMAAKLFASSIDPSTIADDLLAERRLQLTEDLVTLLDVEPRRLLLWCEVLEGALYLAKVKFREGGPHVDSYTLRLDPDIVKPAFELPGWDSAPSRLRNVRIARALQAGWQLFEKWLKDEDIQQPCLVVGPSVLSTWPLDAAEAVMGGHVAPLRPMAFAPAIEVAAMAQRRAGQDIERVLVIPYGGTDLPGVAEELDSLDATYGARLTLLPKDNLSKTTILNALQDEFDVIHFSGHGQFDHLDPMRSAIQFKASGDEHLIFASDFLACGTIGRSPIIVLCACTSAAVMPNGSNNFLGLAGALIRVGATSIVGTRWPITDRTAVAFSRSFHRALALGDTPMVATAKAKTALRDEHMHDWSAFISIGR